ncbi:hypothetical protein FHY35_004024 [Xanthomonas arboricola]|nr:hypothetical protein [Xanthomonas arboricola]
MRKLGYQLRDVCRPSGSPRLSGPLVELIALQSEWLTRLQCVC